MNVPPLLAKQRFGLGGTLAVLALAQAGLAALFAEAMTGIINSGSSVDIMAAAMAIGLAVAIGIFVCAERWIAEKFAQSFVRDCRAAIFDTVIRNRGDGNEARWLNSLIGDLSALRNYAVRGSVRLWTSPLAGLVACIWFVYANPNQAMALMPLVAALILVFPAVRLLDKAIARQRQARG